MNIAPYRKVTGSNKNILDLLVLPGAEDIELTTP
jgi:hypothetical protein